MEKEFRKLGKKYTKGYTVEELINVLKECPKDRKVKYTLGGSADFYKVTYVDKNGPYGESFVVIGDLTW